MNERVYIGLVSHGSLFFL